MGIVYIAPISSAKEILSGPDPENGVCVDLADAEREDRVHGFERYLAEEGPKAWEKRMGKWGAWADQVVIATTPAFLKKCIFLVAFDPATKTVFTTNTWRCV